MLIPENAFSSGVLDKEYHRRLLDDLDNVLETAGIPAHMLWSRLSDHCSETEVEWVKNIRSGTAGLCYEGMYYQDKVHPKMMCIAAACLRNYIDARVMPLQDVISCLKNDEMPQPTVLLIPNFYLSKLEGGDIPTWQISSLLGLLYKRMAQELKTVLYVNSMPGLVKNYGEPFKTHIQANYTLL